MIDSTEQVSLPAGSRVAWSVEAGGVVQSGESHLLLLQSVEVIEGGVRLEAVIAAPNEDLIVAGVAALLDKLEQRTGVTAERIVAFFLLRHRAGIELSPQDVPPVDTFPMPVVVYENPDDKELN